MTPQEPPMDDQLMQAARQALEALENWLGTPKDPKAGWSGDGGTRELYACEYCNAKHGDCAQVPHSSACPIPGARAAIASLREAIAAPQAAAVPQPTVDRQYGAPDWDYESAARWLLTPPAVAALPQEGQVQPTKLDRFAEMARKWAEEGGNTDAALTWMYASPPQARMPLTDAQIDTLWDEARNRPEWTWNARKFARAIEAAHGIAAQEGEKL